MYNTQYLVRLGSVTPQPDKVRSEEEVVEAGVVTVVVTVPEQTDFRKIFSQIKLLSRNILINYYYFSIEISCQFCLSPVVSVGCSQHTWP